jgi:uncharacterized protein YdeI (YjbR/CyaY-like superfamily)
VADELPELVVRDREAWRRWLGSHHAELEEALCHGWIDGQTGRRDEATYKQRFTPRRQRSAWSKRNTDKAARLLAEGRMHPAGIAEMERAKADGRWEAAYAGSAEIEVPRDLAAALAAEPTAQVTFEALNSQNRYAILYRLATAKRPETRARRLEQFVAMLARGETIHPQKKR